VLTSSNTPKITAAQATDLKHTTEHQLGVSGRDPLGHKIGPNVAYRSGAGMNWYPLDIYKQTLCGTLHRFEFWDGAGAEADWNNFIIPSASHAYILEDARPVATPDQIQSCGSPGNCLEAEVTPDERFYENPWFTRSTLQSVVTGKPLCTYGPWVYEEAHGNRPEIHPSELYWWTDTPSPDETTYYLLILQDDSNRFDRTDNYTGSIVRPWSKNPRTGEFRVAFRVTVGGGIAGTNSRIRFNIDELARLNVVTKDSSTARQDAGPGRNHTISFNGRVVVTANELQSNDNDIGVRFENLVQGGGGPLDGPLLNYLHGYMIITTKVGIDDRGNEGLHLIRVRARKSVDQPQFEQVPVIAPPIAPTEPPLIVKPIRSSFRMAVSDGQPTLLADVQVRKAQGGAISTKSGVQSLKGGTIEIAVSATNTIAVKLPTIELSPTLSQAKPSKPIESRRAWQNFARAATLTTVDDSVAIPLRSVDQIRIDAAAFYAPVRNGQVSREEDSPFSEELNDIVRKGTPQRRMAVFGSNQPIKDLRWSFAAKNLTTGESVPVMVGPANESTVGVSILTGGIPNSTIVVTFPRGGTSNAIFEMTATVEMTDSLGKRGTSTHTSWSHFIQSSNGATLADTMLPVLARATGGKPDTLLAASRITNMPANDLAIRDPFSRCARMVRLYLMNAVTQDGMLSLGELHKARDATALCSTR
jgi:hypothetical protein